MVIRGETCARQVGSVELLQTMQSIYWTGRVLSRAIWNGFTNFSAIAEPNVAKRREASLVSAVCGFPKDFARGRMRKGQFGDDAWFSAKFKAVEVIGEFYFQFF